jgi:hypothetical protein
MKHKIFDTVAFQSVNKRTKNFNSLPLSQQKQILYDLEHISKADGRMWGLEILISIGIVIINLMFWKFQLQVSHREDSLLLFIGISFASMLLIWFFLRDVYLYHIYKRDYSMMHESAIKQTKETIKSNELLLATFLSLRGEALRNQMRPILEKEETADFIVETLLDKMYKLPEEPK